MCFASSVGVLVGVFVGVLVGILVGILVGVFVVDVRTGPVDVIRELVVTFTVVGFLEACIVE